MGRISTIKRTPPEIRREVDRLLQDGRYSIADIVDHLRSLGHNISPAAMGRYKQQYAKQMEGYREAQAIASLWVSSFKDAPDSDVGRMLAEMYKVVVFRRLSAMVESGEKIDSKDLTSMARVISAIGGFDRQSVETILKRQSTPDGEFDIMSATLKAIQHGSR